MTAETESAGPPQVLAIAHDGNADVVGLSPVGRGWSARYSLAWFGFWMANLVPLQLLLPDQLAAVDPGSKVRDFALVNGASGAVALVALPVFGALSDRSRSRFGRRRLWIAVGAALFAVGLSTTGAQQDWVSLAVCWSLSMIGLSAMTAGLTAVVADRVPERQRGMISSAIYGPQALGVVVGIAAVSVFSLTSLQAYLLLAISLVLLTMPFVRGYREATGPAATDAVSLRAVISTLRIDVRGNPDFAWAFGGRLLVNLANSLGTCYLLYFLTDKLRVHNPDEVLLELTVVYLLCGLLSTYTAGWLSDRWRRRRVFVAVAAAMQAIAGYLLGGVPTLTFTVLAAAFMGGGFGAYMAVDQALVTQVLPDVRTRAKDLGIMSIGTMIPPTLAPLIAGAIITGAGGYPMLFFLVGAIASLGAILVYRVRTVR
jgi:MFS family permease